MKSFNYTIQDPTGVHARPAGLLVKIVKTLDSSVIIEKDGKAVSADRLLAIMGLGIRCGDTVTVTITGGNESASFETLFAFFSENL